MKRGISLLLSAVLVLGMVSVQGFAMESWHPVDPKGQKDPVQKEEVKGSEEILTISEDSAVVPIAEEKEKLIVTATATVCYGDERPEYKLVCKDTNGVEKDGIITVSQDRITSTYTKGDAAGKEFDIMVNIEGISHDQYVLEAETGKGAVLPRKLTVALEHAEYAYDGTEHTPKVVVNGLLAGDQLEPEFESVSAEDAGDYSIVISNWNGDEEVKKNYELPVGTELPFAVTKRVAVIDWGVLAVTYDGNEHYPDPAITNLVENDDVSIVMSLKDPVTAVGEYKTRVEGLTGADAGNYDWNKDEEVTFTISLPALEAPTGVTAEPETIRGKADGKITGLLEGMEYKLETAATYTQLTAEEIEKKTVENLAAGKYLVRYKETDEKAASEDLPVEVKAGAPLTITLPADQTGYKLEADKTEVAYGESVTITYKLATGYTELESFAVKVNGEIIDLNDKNGSYTIQNITENVTVTVEGVSVILAITFNNETFRTVVENPTFDKYVNAKTLVITGISGGKLWYALKDKACVPAEITDWTEYTKALSFGSETSRKLIAYAKVTDAEGKAIAYVSTYGVVLDHVAPVIKINGAVPTGGKTYYTTQQVTVTEANPVKVTLNDEEKTTPFLLTGNENVNKYTIKATDGAGNAVSRTVKMQKINTLDDTISDLNGTNMTSAKKSTVEAVITKVDTILDNECTNATKEEKAELEAIVDTCNGLLLVLDIQALPKASSVKPDDVEALNKFLEVARAYNALSTSSKNTLGADNKKILEDLYKALTDYDITTKEASLKWTLKSKKTLEVAVNGPESMLKEVRIGGDKLDKDDDYTSKAGTSGGTVITLKAAYLDKLKAGKHTIKIVYEYGETDGKDQIQILNANGTNPKTGDTGVLFWTTASVLSLACLAAVTISGRKRKFQA